MATPARANGSRKRLANSSTLVLFRSSLPLPGWPKVSLSTARITFWLVFISLSPWPLASVWISTVFTAPLPLKSWTLTSPLTLSSMAARILLSSGGLANFTWISVPSLKSMPYLRPPLAMMLVTPATLSTSEAMIKGHFLPRKS